MITGDERDVEYVAAAAVMSGRLFLPRSASTVDRVGADTSQLPCVVVFHDAFGLGEQMMATSRGLANQGWVVFAADVWGGRQRPDAEEAIGPLIGAAVADRGAWLCRLQAELDTAAAQPEVDAGAMAAMGFCFGGSSALELLRCGADLRGVVAVHPGLDLLEDDWSLARTGRQCLICAGADDPLATTTQREGLQDLMTAAGVDWEVDLYAGARHGFTSLRLRDTPATVVAGYHPVAAERARAATLRFLRETFAAPLRARA